MDKAEVVHKTLTVTRDGDWIVANTPAEDRDRDRVIPTGCAFENYLRNPVLLWGHNYREPWAIIGNADAIEVSDAGLRIRPAFREPANEHDPMTVVQLLWENNFVRGASIGFRPLEWEPNDAGGRDYTKWELLEVSLVPVPANQEALRMAVKGLSGGGDVPSDVKAVVPHKRHPLAPESRAWDAAAARTRIRAWAGGDEWSPSRYRQGFVLVDGDPDLLGSYRGPHHDVIDGQLHTVWRGVAAAMQSLVFGARGGRVANDGDRRRVYAHLRAHYREFEKEAPDFKAIIEALPAADARATDDDDDPLGAALARLERQIRAFTEALS